MTKPLKSLVAGLFAITLGSLSAFAPREAGAAKAQAVDFVRDVRPIFEQACNQCHGPKKAMGQLRLDERGPALKGGISGPVIIPGKGQESRLVQRLLGLGGEARMPLGGQPLTEAQINLIRAWIDQGADWPGASGPGGEPQIARHWAYVKPVRPTPPAVKAAALSAWPRNPIDNFILARLEKEGLAPSPEAERATLLRRVYLDLTGLPPSVKEVDEFLADRSPGSYEKVVDRLLASPHYGERWARPWLDLARYADSNGYEKDNLRVMWKYRDWVINALNQDMPFDQFTVEQIAGDMLPDAPSPEATLGQKIATGFHRNTLLNQEGGIDPDEARWETIVDRVNTTATVWLGTTLACAQCHNHKYDPFSQKDYYRFFAFFNNADYRIGYQGVGMGEETRFILEPQIDLPTPGQEAQRDRIEAEIKQLERTLDNQPPELDPVQAEWERELIAESDKWVTLVPAATETTGGTTLTPLADQSILASGANPESEIYIIRARTNVTNVTAVRVEALTDPSLPKGGPGRDPYGNFLLSGFEVTAAPADRPADSQPVVFKDGSVDDSAYKFDARKFFNPPDDGVEMERPVGWFINATSDTVRVSRQAVFVAASPFGFDTGTALTIKLKHLGSALGQGIGRFRLSVTAGDNPEIMTTVTAKLRPVLMTPAAQRTQKQRESLSEQFRAAAPALKAARDRRTALRAALKDLGIATALIMHERPSFERPAAPLRERGSYLSPGEQVSADVPAVLHPMPESQPFNRLGLARWLVDEKNPLAARVAVNRFWEQVFGHGLVETSEDFGTQGEHPSHPELLDWLATEFMRQKWGMKALHRLIVTSATYRQSSAATPPLLERDPYNRLLARGPRFRMEAEMVRDVGLAIGGLLSPKLGGPSVFPPQPEGTWRSPYNDAKWITSKGEDRYRRSLYTFIRRTAPYPSLMTFDATSREVCTVRRVRTNTPLQALTLLNDEAVFEQARALARRMLRETDGATKARLTYGFRLCVARAPEAQELERLLALYGRQCSYFESHPEEAGRVLKGSSEGDSRSELAALTMVANVLLNLDETVTKE